MANSELKATVSGPVSESKKIVIIITKILKRIYLIFKLLVSASAFQISLSLSHSLFSPCPQGYSGTLSSLDTVSILGLATAPNSVTLNGQTITSFTYNSSNKSLNITSLNEDMKKDFSIKWN